MKSLLSLVLIFCLSSCASIIRGTLEDSQRIVVTSSPTNLKLYSNLILICTTPCSAKGADLRSKFLRIRGPNNQERALDLSQKFNSNIAGNIIFGGGPGIIVDIVSGSSLKYPSKIHITLD